MIKNYTVIYSFLILSLVIVVSIFFYTYKTKTDVITKKTNKIENTKINKSITVDESSTHYSDKSTENPTIIENIKYVAMDVSGNKFEIKAKEGTTSSRNYDEVILTTVIAKIWLYNSETIIITSDFANYNKSSVDTIFKDNVEINYINHRINSDKLHLSFKDKLATITSNVNYRGNKTNLYTDNVEIDFKTKKTKIFMNKKNEKVLVKSIY